MTTRCDSNCVLADITSWRGDRQTAEWGHQRKRQTMAAFISPPHIPVEERSWPAVWTWGRLVHSVWVMGLPTAIVTAVKDFSSMSVCFIKYFSSLNQQTASVLSFSAAMSQVCHRVCWFWLLPSFVVLLKLSSWGDSKSAKYKQWHLCSCCFIISTAGSIFT